MNEILQNELLAVMRAFRRNGFKVTLLPGSSYRNAIALTIRTDDEYDYFPKFLISPEFDCEEPDIDDILSQIDKNIGIITIAIPIAAREAMRAIDEDDDGASVEIVAELLNQISTLKRLTKAAKEARQDARKAVLS